jgi:hypothetical protein
MGQFNIHAEVSNRVLIMATPILNTDRMTEIFYADFVDSDISSVRAPLDVFDFIHVVRFGFCFEHVRSQKNIWWFF